MNGGSLKWDEIRGVGTATVNDQFKALHDVTQLDALQDWISDLTEIYNNLQKEFLKPRNEPDVPA